MDSQGNFGANTSQNFNPDAEPSSQGWQRDAPVDMSTEKLAATDKDQISLNRLQKSVISTGELVTTECQGCSENPKTPEDSEPKSRVC